MNILELCEHVTVFFIRKVTRFFFLSGGGLDYKISNKEFITLLLNIRTFRIFANDDLKVVSFNGDEFYLYKRTLNLIGLKCV